MGAMVYQGTILTGERDRIDDKGCPRLDRYGYRARRIQGHVGSCGWK